MNQISQRRRGMNWSAVAILAAGMWLVAGTTAPAQIQGTTALCGCYCGVMLTPPCGDDACKRACGYQEPASSPAGGGYNPYQATTGAVMSSVSNAISSSIANAITNAFNQSQARAAEEQAIQVQQYQQMMQQNHQMIQAVDALSRSQMQNASDLLDNAAKEAKKLDDQQRADTISNLQGVCNGDGELTLKPATDFFGIPGNPTGTTSAENPCAPNPPPVQVPAPVTPATAPAAAPDASAYPPAPPGVQCKWGDQGSSVVDLRCLGLDPDKPIAIDPWVTRGQERVFPAQIDPATFQNEHYNGGFIELMKASDSVQNARDAVAQFQLARLERPSDPLVRDGLGLAEDILKARQQRDQDNQVRAEEQLCHGLAALLLGDITTAENSVNRALKLDPSSDMIAEWSVTLGAMSASFRTPGRDVKTVEMLVGNALVSEARGNYTAELNFMQMAKSLAPPGDKYVATLLDHAKALAAENPVHNAMHP